MRPFRVVALLALVLAAAGPAAADLEVDARIQAGADVRVGVDATVPPLASLPASVPVVPDLDSFDVAPANVGMAGIHAGASATTSTRTHPAAAAAAAAVAAVPEPAREAAPAALAATGTLALLQAFGAFRALGLAGVALYSRLTRSELLDNEQRDRVFKLVKEQPGIGPSEVASALGLGWGTTVYHLDRLEKAGFVASERSGSRRCFFPVGTLPREARPQLGALAGDTTRSLAEYLVGKPGATQSDVCEALGLSASAASKQVSKLEAAGLVRREREWKTVHLFPEPALASLLASPASEAPPAHPSAPAGLPGGLAAA